MTDNNPLFFHSPQEAVSQITEMLKNEKWEKLTRYYYLKNSKVNKAELCSGQFFIRQQKPELAHPGGFWRYKHPFSPGFQYQSHESSENSIISVTVDIEIDQGEGMIQRAFSVFKMIDLEQGFQLLPD